MRRITLVAVLTVRSCGIPPNQQAMSAATDSHCTVGGTFGVGGIGGIGGVSARQYATNSVPCMCPVRMSAPFLVLFVVFGAGT